MIRRTVDLAPIDLLEDKLKALVALVERLKGDAPIWKKERWAGGESWGLSEGSG